jgi:DNA-directed RNA polymerase specialized sigma24 family protein
MMARNLRAQFSDVPDEPDDIAQLTLADLFSRDSLAQFGRPDPRLTTQQRWSRERFLAWLYHGVLNTWRIRRRQTANATARDANLSEWQEWHESQATNMSYSPDLSDALAKVESDADTAQLVREVERLLADYALRSPTKRAQVYCFQVYIQSVLDAGPFDRVALARRYGVTVDAIGVWLFRVRDYLRAQLHGTPGPSEPPRTRSIAGQSGRRHEHLDNSVLDNPVDERITQSVESSAQRHRARRV